MTVPLILLARRPRGWRRPRYLGGGIVHWLEPAVGEKHAEARRSRIALTVITLLVVLARCRRRPGCSSARRAVPTAAPAKVSPFTAAARRDLYGDAFNEAVFMRPGQEVTPGLVGFDNRGVDGVVNGLAALFGGVSGRVRRVQTGFVRSTHSS